MAEELDTKPKMEGAGAHVRSGGIFVAFTPNGSEERMQKTPASYHRQWGAVHPSYLDRKYWFRSFVNRPKLITSNPYDLSALEAWDQTTDSQGGLDGSELLFVAKLD